MNIYKLRLKMFMIISLTLFFSLGFLSYGQEANQTYLDNNEKINLTEEEKEYIVENPVITAIVMEGVAPIQYIDINGEFTGISKLVLEEIMDNTGIVFEYEFKNTIDEIMGYDGEAIIVGISPNYAPPEMVLSESFLKSSTILYLGSSVNPDDLNKRIYAGIKDSKLPEGIKKENTKYYNTREDSLNAVDSGEADYGYGNAYSVAFYTLQNGYKNIISIPNEKENRAYSIGFLNENKLLVSIINKSLKSIDEIKMQNLILKATSNIDRKVTLSMVLDSYGYIIIPIIFGIIMLLILGISINIKSNIKLKMQNKRYEILADISNEYLYEYFIKDDELNLSQKCIQLFGSERYIDDSINILKKAIKKMQSENENSKEIELLIDDNKINIFKMVNFYVYEESGKLRSIIGKLIDISEEAQEKKALSIKAETDGLTNLYNYSTTKNLIIEKMKTRDKIDALIIIDVDYFKKINDNLGHHTGNLVLKSLAKSLKQIFRKEDIIGRIGGDEFSVYMQNVPSGEFVKNKCDGINKLYNDLNGNTKITLSIGIALLVQEESYYKLFQRADLALYQAKNKGKNQSVIFSEDEIDKQTTE